MSNQPYPPDPRMQNYAQQPGQDPSHSGANDDTVQSYNVGPNYVRSEHESYVDQRGNMVDSRQEVSVDKNQQRAYIRYWISAVTYFLLSVLEVILLLRLIFRLLGANPYNGFISFLYDLSHIFVAPFNNIFNDQTIGRAGVFEISTLIAMLVYALIAWGIVALGRVIFAPLPSDSSTYTTTRRSRYS